MRDCLRCKTEMIEGFDMKVERAWQGIKVSEGTYGFEAKEIEKPKIAICPKCGELSIYIEHLDRI